MSQIDRSEGLVGNTAIKAPVRCATIADITLNGEQTVDGIACLTGDRVLVKDQDDATQNGIWVCDTGDWNRGQDFDGALDVTEGTFVMCLHGTTNGNTYWRQTAADPIEIETTEIEFTQALTFSGTLADGSVTGTLTLEPGATLILSAAAALSVGAGEAISNGYLNARVDAGTHILTLELLATGGGNATATNPITAVFRNSSISVGSLVGLAVTAALNQAIASGSTLGCAASETVRVHCGLMANGKMFYWTATVGSLTSIVKPDINGFVTTVAEAGNGDLAQTFYSDAVYTNQPWRYLGYVEVVSGATPGVWASVSKIVNWQTGVPMPGDVVGYSYTAYTGVASGGTVMPGDDTIPQITEGDQFMTVSHTQKSALNVLEAYALAYLSPATAAGINLGMYKNGAVDAVVAGTTNPLLGTGLGIGLLKNVSKAAATIPAVYTFRAGNGSGYVDTFNGASTSRLFGGAINSYFEVTERQG